MIERQTTSPRFRPVHIFIPALFGKEFHVNLQRFVWKRHFGALLRGTNMASVNQQRHLSLSLAIEMKNYYSRVLTQ